MVARGVSEGALPDLTPSPSLTRRASNRNPRAHRSPKRERGNRHGSPKRQRGNLTPCPPKWKGGLAASCPAAIPSVAAGPTSSDALLGKRAVARGDLLFLGGRALALFRLLRLLIVLLTVVALTHDLLQFAKWTVLKANSRQTIPASPVFGDCVIKAERDRGPG